jgi:hypothetical protein
MSLREDFNRDSYSFWVGHPLSGDGIDCGTFHRGLSRALETIQGRYGELLKMDNPLPKVTRFWTYNGYLVVLIEDRLVGNLYCEEELSQCSDGADL